MARISSDTAEVRVEAIDSTKAGLDSVRANIQNLERSVLSLQKMIMQATGAVLAMKGAWNLADQAAGFMEQEAALNRLAAAYGSSSKIMVDSIKQAADGTISSLDAVNIATQGLAKGLTPDQITSLTQVAKAYGDITNQSTAQALNEIATAAETGRSRMLMQAGILVDLNKAWDEYAKSTGRTVDQLTRAEKQQVSINAIMRASNDVMTRTASTGMTAADAMDRFKAALSDIGIVTGKVVITIVTGIFAITQGVSKMVNEMIAKVLFGLASILTAVDNFVQKLPIDQAIKDMTHSAAAGVLEIDKYFADSAALAADNYKQSAEMIKGIWSDLGTLPQTPPLKPPPDEGGGGSSIDNQLAKLKEVQVVMASISSAFSPYNELATMNTQIENLNNFYNQKIELSRAAGVSEVEITRIKAAQTTAIEQQNYQMRVSFANTAMGAMVGITQNLYNASGQKSKEMFELNKAFSIGQAIMSTYEGANKALAMGPWGIPIAALIVASGLANVAAIASTQPGSAGTPSGGGGGAPTGGGFSNSSLQPTQTQQETSYSVTVDATGAHMFTAAGVDMIFKEINNAIKTKGQRFEGVKMVY